MGYRDQGCSGFRLGFEFHAAFRTGLPAMRLSKRRIKEALRLRYELGLGQRQIARSCSIGQSTVFDYWKRAEAAGLRWPLPDDWDDDRIERSLFAHAQHPERSPERPQPDFESIHEQLKRHSNLNVGAALGRVSPGTARRVSLLAVLRVVPALAAQAGSRASAGTQGCSIPFFLESCS